MDLTWVNKPTKDKTYWAKVWISFKSGDKRSFEKIYTEFSDVLYAYGSKMTDDLELVKDAIQDIFINLYNYNIDLNNPESIEYYLIKSLKRQIIGKLILNSKHESINNENLYTFNLQYDLDVDIQNSETEISRNKSIKKILDELDHQKRELLYLRFNTGLSYIQIGNILDLKPDTVKKQMYRLLEHIRKKHGAKLLELLLLFLK